jgi:L-ribulokinase
MQKENFVLGVDYGTDSVRSLLINAADGSEVASAVFYYPRWKDGLYCKPSDNRFRQHPLDYIEGLEQTIRSCLAQAGPAAARNVAAISIDTTGSTPVAVDETGTPLGLLPEFSDNPNALFVLWKDHTAVKEAAAINAHAATFPINYLQFVGGIYSSEWFWAKLLHILRIDPAVRAACYSWVEHCDWIPFLLTGGNHVSQMKRGVCAAGHKALWAPAFGPVPDHASASGPTAARGATPVPGSRTARGPVSGGFPPDNFFSSLDPLLKGFTTRLSTDTYTADIPAGTLCPEWASRLGLSTDVVIGVGAFDAHMGAVGGQIEPYHLSKVMGTSTCDMLVAPLHEVEGRLVKGICGQVPGSVIPGMMGMEAGQSAFGDAYAWFRNLLSWPLQQLLPSAPGIPELSIPGSSTPAAIPGSPAPAVAGSSTNTFASSVNTPASSTNTLISGIIDRIIPELGRQAAALDPSPRSELALDWFNGRRTPDANQWLKGAITGLDLGSDAPRLFRAIVEATCFGARAIVDRFTEEGVPIRGLIGLGGVAKKSPFIMQMMADVMDRPIRIHASEQTCALGAAMFAATAAGLYPTVEDAMAAIGQGFDATYTPDPRRTAIYAGRLRDYQALGQFIQSTTKEK